MRPTLRATPDARTRLPTRVVKGGRTLPDRFLVGDVELPPPEICRRLTPYLSPERAARIERVLDGRTYGIATVVEGLANSGNVSAVMRTAEGFGFQRFDLVAGEAPFKHSRRTAQGADKWLDVRGWYEPADCADALRKEGYRIVAAHLAEGARASWDIDFTRRTAIVFGNEMRGVSPVMLSAADDLCVVPIDGFVQSFNISVAAAMLLYQARMSRERAGLGGDLTDDERGRMRAEFYRRSVRNCDLLLAQSLANDP